MKKITVLLALLSLTLPSLVLKADDIIQSPEQTAKPINGVNTTTNSGINSSNNNGVNTVTPAPTINTNPNTVNPNNLNPNTNLNPNNFGRRPGDNTPPEQLNPGQQMEQQLEQQRKENYKTLKQDEQDYYKNAAPKSSEQPNYFLHSHPIKPAPLKSHLVQ